MTKETTKRRRLFRTRLKIILGAIALTFVVVFWISRQIQTLAFLGPMPACDPSVAHLDGAWGTATVNVELALTNADREKGLMFREYLAPGAGMMFVYPQPQMAAFWMKDTMIPLDILFFDTNGNLRHVHFNAIPHDETPILGGDGIKYVIEVASGEVAKLAIGPQTTLRHPSLDQTFARWKC